MLIFITDFALQNAIKIQISQWRTIKNSKFYQVKSRILAENILFLNIIFTK